MSSQVWNLFLEASGGTTLATNIGANNLDTRMMLRHLTIFVFYLAPGKFFLSNIGANGLETRISLRHLTIFGGLPCAWEVFSILRGRRSTAEEKICGLRNCKKVIGMKNMMLQTQYV